jgi:hypothetical protein
MAKFIVGAALALSLAACGGGGGSTAPTKAAPAAPADSLVVIGNSLTVHPIDASLNWTHVSGMAASDEAHDYAHVVGTTLGLPVTAYNIGALERDGSRTDLVQASTAMVNSRTDVVVQIGENAPVGGSPEFTAIYGQLLDAVVARHPHSLACLSSYWDDPIKDAAKKTSCEAHGGTFVNLIGIYAAHLDTIPTGENPAISAHPHDPSMAAIAAKIVAAWGSAV